MDSNTFGLLVGFAIAVVVGFAVMTALPAPDETTEWHGDVTPAPVPGKSTPTLTPTPTPEPFVDEGLEMGGFGEELGGDPAGDADRTVVTDETGFDAGGFGEEIGGDPAGRYCPEPPDLTSSNWRRGLLDEYREGCSNG